MLHKIKLKNFRNGATEGLKNFSIATATAVANFFSLIRTSHLLMQHDERDIRFAAITDLTTEPYQTAELSEQKIDYKRQLPLQLKTQAAIEDYALHEQRRVFIAEGDLAYQKYQAMEEAIALCFKEYKAFADVANLSPRASNYKNALFLLCDALTNARPILIPKLPEHVEKLENKKAIKRFMKGVVKHFGSSNNCIKRYLIERIKWESQHPGEKYPEPYIEQTVYQTTLELFKKKFALETPAPNRRSSLAALSRLLSMDLSQPTEAKTDANPLSPGNTLSDLDRTISILDFKEQKEALALRHQRRDSIYEPPTHLEINITDEKSFRILRKYSQATQLIFPGLEMPTFKNTVNVSRNIFRHPVRTWGHLLDIALDQMGKYFKKEKPSRLLYLPLILLIIMTIVLRSAISALDKTLDASIAIVKGTTKCVHSVRQKGLKPAVQEMFQHFKKSDSKYRLSRTASVNLNVRRVSTGQTFGRSLSNSPREIAIVRVSTGNSVNLSAKSVPSTPREPKPQLFYASTNSLPTTPRERKNEDGIRPDTLRNSFNSLVVPQGSPKIAWGTSILDLRSPSQEHKLPTPSRTPSGNRQKHFLFSIPSTAAGNRLHDSSEEESAQNSLDEKISIPGLVLP